MSDEPENHTIRLLQELREDISDLRSETRSELLSLRAELRETRDDLTVRIDGNTLILNMLAGLVSQHEDRVTELEDDAARA